MLNTNLAYKQIVSYSRHTVNPQWSDLIALQVIFHLTKTFEVQSFAFEFSVALYSYEKDLMYK